MKPKFTLRDLFWLVLVCALCCAWWGERAKVQELQDTERRLEPFFIGDAFTPDLESNETMEASLTDDLKTLVVRVKKSGRTVMEREYENLYAPYEPYKCDITVSTNSGS